MADRPELGDTPAGRALAKQPKPKAKPKAAPKSDNWGAVKELIKNAATGGAYDKTMPPWQKGD